ncbi:MAG TPA: transposase [Myxococcales bacterium]|nr:transposase [Myxococcales bacterium]
MARLARAVVPNVPHHVTQRGNRRQRTFFSADDYLLYTTLMAKWCRHYGVEVWAYCWMPNHTHMIAVPSSPDALRRAIGEAHRRYTLEVNQREGWTGHLWQGRFASFAMDERHTVAAARYVELNPVRAGLVNSAADYPWSSARAHLLGGSDPLVAPAPLLTRVGEWSAFLRTEPELDVACACRKHEGTGRPLGSDVFIDQLESQLGRVLRPRKPGPPPARA